MEILTTKMREIIITFGICLMKNITVFGTKLGWSHHFLHACSGLPVAPCFVKSSTRAAVASSRNMDVDSTVYLACSKCSNVLVNSTIFASLGGAEIAG